MTRVRPHRCAPLPSPTRRQLSSQRVAPPQSRDELAMSPWITDMTAVEPSLFVVWDSVTHAGSVLPHSTRLTRDHVLAVIDHNTTNATDVLAYQTLCREVLALEEFWKEVWSLMCLARALRPR